MSDQIIGRNPVLEALRSGRSIHKILVAQGASKGSVLEILGVAKDRRIQIQEVTRKHMDTLTGSANHQGVVALAAAKNYAELEDILQVARERGEDLFILILDEIEDRTISGLFYGPLTRPVYMELLCPNIVPSD